MGHCVPQGARFPQGCSERCPGGAASPSSSPQRNPYLTPESQIWKAPQTRLMGGEGAVFISIPSGRTLLKVAQWCSLALAFLTGPVHLPWSKEEELEAWRGGTAAQDAHRTEQGWTTTWHFTIRKGLSTPRDLHNSWPAADNTAFHTSNTKLIRGWIIVLCATEKENIGN